MKSCIFQPGISIETLHMKKVCKYHKRAGQVFAERDIVRDFCPDAFYVAYPYCLALLYNADRNEFADGRLTLSCPHPEGIVMELRRIPCRPRLLQVAKKAFEWVLRRNSFLLDWEDWKIGIEVVDDKGGCPCHYRKGTVYWFNTRRVDELCPASFHAVYPHLMRIASGKKLSWQGERGGPPLVHCPDHEGITYKIKKGIPG